MEQVKIHHILKNGTEVDDIQGHMIKAEEFPVLYEVINRIQKGGDADVKRSKVVSTSG